MLAEIAARLTAAAPLFTSVSGAEDLAALGEGTAPADLSAYVLPFASRAEPNQRATGGTLQRIEVQFLVAVCIRRHGDAKGGTRIGVTDAVEKALEVALLGWSPTIDAEPVQFAAGRSQPAKNGVLWHVTTWTTGRVAEEP